MERKETRTGGKHKRHKMLLRRLRYSTTMRLHSPHQLLCDNFLFFHSLRCAHEIKNSKIRSFFAFSFLFVDAVLLLLLRSMIYSRKKLFWHFPLSGRGNEHKLCHSLSSFSNIVYFSEFEEEKLIVKLAASSERWISRLKVCLNSNQVQMTSKCVWCERKSLFCINI